MTVAQVKKQSIYFDPWILISTVSLLIAGLVMVASASMVISDKQYGQPFHYLSHQIVYLLVSLFFSYLVFRVEIRWLQSISPYLLLASLLLLVLVLIPGVGHQVNGSMRWLGFGPFTLQPSEVAKFATVLYMAGYLVRRDEEVRTQISGFIKPMIVLSVFAILLLLEPDFGATAVLMMTALGMMFLAGMRLSQFIMLFSTVAVGLAAMAIAAPYRMARLTTFLHPWADQFDTGYQLTQSLIAFGRGGVFGVGLGNSVQKLYYLPEAHTDFLFAVLGEEFGLMGVLFVIALFMILVGRSLLLGVKAHREGFYYSAYTAFGFSLWLGLQAMINIGVNTGLCPTKGLTLPLMSYGGSSMVINCVVIAILLRIAHEINKQNPPNYPRGKRA